MKLFLFPKVKYRGEKTKNPLYLHHIQSLTSINTYGKKNVAGETPANYPR